MYTIYTQVDNKASTAIDINPTLSLFRMQRRTITVTYQLVGLKKLC